MKRERKIGNKKNGGREEGQRKVRDGGRREGEGEKEKEG